MNFFLVILINIVSLKDCSVIHQNQRIIGGDAVNIRDYKYQVSLILKYTQSEGAKITQFRGGAVIVSKQWAVTTAHCVAFIDINLFAAELVYIRGGTAYWENANGSYDHKVVLREMHPNYDEVTTDYDFALLKVERPFYGRNERPIRVAGKNYKIPMDAEVVVSGWGTTSNAQIRPQDRLRAVTLIIVDQDNCRDVFTHTQDAEITDRMICAWEDRRDACLFDSGGPLVHGTVLIGLASWGVYCASPVYPGVYTRLSAFERWLRSYEAHHHIHLGISFQNN